MNAGILFVFGSILLGRLTVAANCDVAQEGSRHEIFYHVTDGQVSSAQWYQVHDEFPVLLASCKSLGSDGTLTCTSRDPTKYQLQENNRNFTLTILNVTRVGLLPFWFGTDVDPHAYSCNLIVNALPEGRIATGCPSGGEIQDGYIKSGTTSTCRCDRVYDGFPFGQVQWYNTAGQEVGTVADDGEYATITIPTNDSAQNFTCKGKSILGVQSSGESFSLKFAYGPNQVNIGMADSTSTTIDLCPNTNRDITIQCQVPRDDVIPHPSFSVLFNDTSKQGVNPGSDVYMYKVTNTLDTAGTLNVTCTAVNSVFSDLNKEDDLRILVREPPGFPPEIIINSNQPVVENVPFIVSCHVHGGFPLVHSINMTCRSNNERTSVTSDTNVASQNMIVSRDMDGVQCDCVAQHVTGCYFNNQARASLPVTHKVAIKTFTANNIQTLTADLNDSINLTCVAVGSPLPTITIQNHRHTDQKSGEGHRLTYVKDNVTCTDTATYTCQANNFLSMDELQTAEVQVFVRCPPQLQHADKTVFSATVGKSVTLDLDVICYPAPRSYTLKHGGDVVADVSATDGNGSSGSYHFKYESHDPPFGTVQLTIGNVSQEQFIVYLLAVDNGVGQALGFSFVLEKVSEPVQSSETDIVPIAAGIAGGIVLLVLVVVIIVVVKRNGKPKQRGTSSKRNDDQKDYKDEGLENEGFVQYQPTGPSRLTESRATVYLSSAENYLYKNTTENVPSDSPYLNEIIVPAENQRASLSSPGYENEISSLEPAHEETNFPLYEIID